MFNMILWGVSNAFTTGPVQAMVVGSVGMGERTRVLTVASVVNGLCGFLGQLVLFYLFARTGNSWEIDSISFIMVVGYIICVLRALLFFRMRYDAMLPDGGGSLADEPANKEDAADVCCPGCK